MDACMHTPRRRRMLFSQALPHCAGGLHGFNSADLRLGKTSLKGCIFFPNGLYFFLRIQGSPQPVQLSVRASWLSLAWP